MDMCSSVWIHCHISFLFILSFMNLRSSSNRVRSQTNEWQYNGMMSFLKEHYIIIISQSLIHLVSDTLISLTSAQWCVLTISSPLGVEQAPAENSWGIYEIKNVAQKKLAWKGSGIPEAEIFGQKRKFSLFGFRFRPPKFYSKYSAFRFVLKMSCS